MNLDLDCTLWVDEQGLQWAMSARNTYSALTYRDRKRLLRELWEFLKSPDSDVTLRGHPLAWGPESGQMALMVGNDLWVHLMPGPSGRVEVSTIWRAPASSAAFHHTPPAFARQATDFAAWVAGGRRPHLRGEWATLLYGDTGQGAQTRREQLALALGFLLAALRMRVRDGVRPFWQPVDWLLRVQPRTNAFITMVVGCQAVFIVGDDGLSALLTEAWEPCGIAGGSLFAVARWLRRIRGIELATPVRESTDE